jgi:hypothetical protein
VSLAGHQWLTPIILATQKAEIRMIMVQSQPRQIVSARPSLKKPFTKIGAGEVAQGDSPEFKSQYRKKKNKKKTSEFNHKQRTMGSKIKQTIKSYVTEVSKG